MKIVESLSSIWGSRIPLNTEVNPIVDLKQPPVLSFPLYSHQNATCEALVDKGDRLQVGKPVWRVEGRDVFPSPLAGTVIDLVNVPDPRGERMVPSVSIEPDFDDQLSNEVFSKLDPQKNSLEELKQRVVDAGIMTDRLKPRPLLDLFEQKEGKRLNALVVLALDREPLMNSYLQQYKDRSDDVIEAVNLLGLLSGASKTYLGLPKGEQKYFHFTEKGANLTPLWIKPVYPEALNHFITQKTGYQEGVAVVGVEKALAVYDAILNGTIQQQKVLTVIGPNEKVMGNYRAWIGTSFQEIFRQLKMVASEQDKVVAGGPMQGVAQYSLEGTVDSGINALMLIPADSIVHWSTEPCINCGQCIKICPVSLQVQLIGRYSEFSLFERTREYDIDQCMECGLCASVCVARRPLVQYVALAKKQLHLNDFALKAKSSSMEATIKGKPILAASERDPALSIFSGLPRFTVGFAPHQRSSSNITKMNVAFILALLPTLIVSAFAQFFGDHAIEIDARLVSVSPLLKSIVTEMGLDTGFLWFSGVIGISLFGMGMGMLTEYLCQVVMRQPYHATNGHGALIGLLIAMMMPPLVPIWIMVVAVVVAIFIGKQIFGGIGGYPMHPALVGWLVVFLSWPNYVYPIKTASISSYNTAVIVMTILGGLILILRGYVRIEVTLGVLAGAIAFSFIFQNWLSGDLIDHLFTGHLFLAAFFLATDATCSPANGRAMWAYGFGIGFLIVLIRAFGVWPDAIPFAVLLMNILSPLLDRLKPKVIKLVV